MGGPSIPGPPSITVTVDSPARSEIAPYLDFEAEEASILTATRHLRLDLAVEESGTLELLSACIAREQPDVVQVSCHGTLQPEPGLLLEDEVGDPAFARTSALVNKLAAPQRRLIFLSACETAEAHPVLDSLARSLVRSGAPAVLGWAAPVLDREATQFAAGLYARLLRGEHLAQAHAGARAELVEKLNDQPPDSHDWHLPRLYLAANGGGVLARADAPQRHLGQGQAVKTFLDTKGKQVPVASAQEFVGRRREIQNILREFRAPPGERHAGVLIHGVGRQGKSSLAARVAHRLEHTHETVVIFGRYDAPYILRQLGEQLGTPAVADVIARHLPAVESDPAKLQPAFTELLQGPCAQGGDADGTKPVLLVIDDFEQALDEENHRTLKPEYFGSLRALLLAFQNAATESHLLVTSRFQFTCPHDGHDLADDDHLLHVPLHGMNEREAGKQAQAKLRLPDIARAVGKLKPERRRTLEDQIARAITNARGNPGLQDLLFTLAVQNPVACDRCLTEMEEFLKSGKLPAAEAVRKFLENLALSALTGLLTPAQREILRAATLFELPVPVPVMQTLAERAAPLSSITNGGEGRGEEARDSASSEAPLPYPLPAHSRGEGENAAANLSRLRAFGLLEVYEDLHDAQAPALALNALVRPLAGTLNDTEQAALAGAVTGALFEHWGGETGGRQRGYLQDHELARLGQLARDARVLAATGADALRFLDNQFQYRQAAAWSKAILAIVDAAGVPASVELLRTAAERCQQVGEVKEARTCRERAMQILGQGGEADTVQNAATLLTHARALVQQGQPDEAVRRLEQAQKLFTGSREKAIVLGDIARIWAAKGEVDAALQLHQERLVSNRELGRIEGVTNALWNIAQIELQQEKWQGAYDHLAESYEILEKTGRLDGICFVGLDLGQLLCMAGQREQGLAILNRSRDGFLKLGQPHLTERTQALLDQFSQSP